MESHRRTILFVLLVAASIVSLFGCAEPDSADGNTVTGVVTEVSGDLTTVSAFVVLAPDGSSHRFVPADGLLFDGGPLSHLREHVVTGQFVIVTHERGTDGELIAVRIEDA